MTHPIVKFEDIRQGDTLRWYRYGVSFQAVADQQISHDTWDTDSGVCIIRKGSDKVLYLIDRLPQPTQPEPRDLGAVVESSSGIIYVRTPSLYPIDREVWCDAGGDLRTWDTITKPVTIRHTGWIDQE